MAASICYGIAILNVAKVHGQKISLDEKSIGMVRVDDSITAGTGFVALKTTYVFTCLHVLRGSDNISFQPNS